MFNIESYSFAVPVFKLLFAAIVKHCDINDWDSFNKHQQSFYFDDIMRSVQHRSVEVWLTTIVSIIKKQESFPDFCQTINYVSKDSIMKSMMNNGMKPKAHFHNQKRMKHDQMVSTIAMQGKTIDGWIIGNILGKGGFGTVYRARYAKPRVRQRIAAIKFISINNSNSKYIDLIANEIKALAKIDHSNVIKLLSFNANVDKHAMLVFK